MKHFFNTLFGVLFIALALVTFGACEDEDIEIGSNIVGPGVSSTSSIVNLIAYNSDLDSIRSDENVLQNASLGVYSDNVFGKTKSKFITQVRPELLITDFGENVTVDSVVLRIPIFFDSSTDVNPVSVDTTFIYEAPEDSTDQDTLLIESHYLLDSIYGQTDLPMTLQVRPVTEFLYATDTIYYSNPDLRDRDNISVSNTVIGEVQLSKNVTTQTLRTSGSSSDLFSETPSVEITLDKNFFKTAIIEQDVNNLSSIANFIRNTLPGLEFSVLEDQGFIWAFNPGAMSMAMYYTLDNTACDGVITGDTCTNSEGSEFTSRVQRIYNFNLRNIWSSGFNAQLNQIANDRTGTTYETVLNNANPTLGDERLFIDGMSGSRAILELNTSELEAFKTQARNNNWAILSAQLRLHQDESISPDVPQYLMAWHEYTDSNGNEREEWFDDMVAFGPQSYPFGVQFNRPFDYSDEGNGYHQIHITEHIKNIVEKDSVYANSKIVVANGNFLLSNITAAGGSPVSNNPFINNRAYNPSRTVLHGNRTTDADKKLKLEIFYTNP